MTDLYKGQDPRCIGTYTTTDAAHYLRIPSSTLRSWVFGYRYQTGASSKRFEPVIKLPDPEVRLLSFTNLVELHVLNAIRSLHRISLDNVRKSIAFIEQSLKLEHPLAHEKLYTDGLDLFVEEFGQLVNVSKQGQIAIRGIVEAHLKRIEWDEVGIAARLYPFIRPSKSKEPMWIVIDPRVSFGRPVIVGTGIPTEIFAQRYKAGESIDDLAMDYECERLQVEEAIRCELSLAA